MYGNHSYHIIDHFTPPSLAADKKIQESFLCLEEITARSIIKSENRSNILSRIPWLLHSVIWKTYLGDKFSSFRDSVSLSDRDLDDISLHNFSDISELLYHWPHQEFSLKEVMPRFPSKLCSWTHFSYEAMARERIFARDWPRGPPLHLTRTYLQGFYRKVADAVLGSFIKIISNNISNIDKDVCKIRKLDISGFSFMWYHMTESNHLFKHMFSDENPFGSNSDNIEIIVDADIRLKNDKILYNQEFIFSDDEYSSDLEDSDEDDNDIVDSDYSNNDKDNISDKAQAINENKSPIIADSYTNSPNSVFRFGRLNFHTHKCTQEAVKIIGNFISERTESVDFEEIPMATENFMKDVFQSPLNQNIVTLGVCNKLSSIDFLHHFKNLKHLDISRQNLHKKLNPLLHMENGLLSLNLCGCYLNNSDLDILLKSYHKSSLLELNLGHNFFHDDVTNLMKLCHVLPCLNTFHLEHCKLGELSNNDLRHLCTSFKSLPNLVYLNLNENQFRMEVIKSHLILLRECPMLRLLLLEEAEPEEKSSLITTMMSQNRKEILYVQGGGYF